jgi:hypothetical protein
MLIYEDEQDVIDAVRKNCERKITLLDNKLKRVSERSHDGIAARAARAAYGDVLWLLTDYTLRIDENMAASGD